MLSGGFTGNESLTDSATPVSALNKAIQAKMYFFMIS
jgi:hypothetical protein